MSDSLRTELKNSVRHHIGAIATPDCIHDASCGLPKTRSGKIMRRILRKIANREEDSGLGDTTTLADPSVVEQLLHNRTTAK
jgi:acetyl-CoA synthetase